MGYFIATIALSIVWGVVTNKVIENKGYDENWFWWGFFFGIFALIVAITKPECRQTENRPKQDSTLSRLAAEKEIERKEKKGCWKCSCGEYNQDYETSCHNCGKQKKVVSVAQNWRCECGAMNTRSETVCHRCGKATNRPTLWKCECLTVNQPEDTVCINCGKLKPADKLSIIDKKAEITVNPIPTESDDVAINSIIKYKELLDSGIISEEEFTAKKKELLKL